MLAVAPLALKGRPPIGGDDVVVKSDIIVRMRDGVRLATDVYRPARNGKAVGGAFPVILERTPYGKSITSRAELTARRDGPVRAGRSRRSSSATATS